MAACIGSLATRAASPRKRRAHRRRQRERGQKAASDPNYQTFRQLVDDDPRMTNEMWEDAEQPGIGVYRMPRTPLDFSAVPRTPVRRAPLLGGSAAS